MFFFLVFYCSFIFIYIWVFFQMRYDDVLMVLEGFLRFV